MANSEFIVKIFASREVADDLRDGINAFLLSDNEEGAIDRALARNKILNALEMIDGFGIEEVKENGETE